MPFYHKYKQKALDWVKEQIQIRYRCIIVAEKDYLRWGRDLDACIHPPWEPVHIYWTRTQIIIGKK